ncbi:hypothetical protein H5410_035478 [Solanum commersonii]|uniref:Uncharacterized protein n=1 Tax=Solanum commersonii TaxID=4109 RepID=A0A9J5Y594_SOLCO|nr:hypothetical protein H5410_035478 [Solanum commersonii]
MIVDPLVFNTEADTWPTENVQTPQPAVVEDGAAVMPDIAIEHTIPAAEENVMNQSTEKEQRRSTRSSKAPLWQKDFVISGRTKQTNCLYSISDSVNYGHLSRPYQCFGVALLSSFNKNR